MKKLFKSITTTIMAAVMLVTFCMPATAAELVADKESATQLTSNTDNTFSTMAQVGWFEYTGSFSAGKNLGNVIISSPAKTVKWVVGSPGQDVLVNFRLTNISTGETRSLSTYANGEEDSMTWITSIPAGVWQVSPIYVSSRSTSYVRLSFFK